MTRGSSYQELAAGLRQPFRLTPEVNSELLMAGRFAFGKTVPGIFKNALGHLKRCFSYCFCHRQKTILLSAEDLDDLPCLIAKDKIGTVKGFTLSCLCNNLAETINGLSHVRIPRHKENRMFRNQHGELQSLWITRSDQNRHQE